jgi:hypothetical protein
MSKRPVVTLYLLRAVCTLHLLLAVMQPLMAGLYLAGEADAMNKLHSPIGASLWMLSLLQFPVAVLYWRPGGGRLFPAVVTLVLFFAEFAQLILGSTHQVAMHVPLGTLIVTTVLGLTLWTYSKAARQPRASLVARSNETEVPA